MAIQRSLTRIIVAFVLLGCGDRSSPTAPKNALIGSTELASAAAGLTPPSNPNARALSDVKIQIGWEDNSSKETGFQVYFAANGSSTFTPRGNVGANVVAYVDTGLVAAARYCYKVRALANGNQLSAFSTAACTTTREAAPSNVATKPLDSVYVTATWTDNSRTENGFLVERAPATAGPWDSLATTAPNVTNQYVRGLGAESTACYRITAIATANNSAPSVASCTAAPRPPAIDSTTAADAHSIDVAWTDKSGVEDGYEIQRSSAGLVFVTIANLAANAVTYRDAGLASDATYWYRVRAKKDGGFSAFSNVQTAVVDPAFTSSLQPPSATTASSQQKLRISLSWIDNTTRETGFQVHRSTTGPTGAFSLLATTDANAIAYSDSGLTASTRYCYKVRAVQSARASSYSNVSCATTNELAPTDARAIPYYDYANLSWTDNSSNESGFAIERAGSAQGPWTTWTTVGANVNSYAAAQTLGREVLTCFRVVAFSGAGASEPSNLTCATNVALATAFTARRVGANSIDLAWVDNSAVEDGYKVSRRSDSGPLTVVAMLPPNAVSYQDTGLGDGYHFYFVEAVKDGGTSGESSGAGVVIATTVTAAPTITAYGSASSNLIAVLMPGTADSALVERSIEGAAWVNVGVPSAGYLWDTGQFSELHVCYRAIAFNAVGASPPSDSSCVLSPAAPTLASASITGDSIRIELTDNSQFEEGYYVYRFLPNVPDSELVAILPANTTSFAVLTPRPYGDWVDYSFVAFTATGSADAFSTGFLLVPYPISYVTATALSATSVNLRWRDYNTQDHTVSVERCRGAAASCTDSSYSVIATFDQWWQVCCGWNDVTAAPATTYTYRVRATNQAGVSLYSNLASVATPAAP